MNIASPEGATVWFTKYGQYKRCSRASKRISRASQEKAGREKATTGPLAPQEKSGLQRKGST